MCLNFVIVKIGCDNDNTIKIDTKIVEDVMNSSEQIYKNSVGVTSNAINALSFTNNGSVICNFEIYQGNINNTTIVNTFSPEQASQINTDLENKVADDIDQEQTEGILSFLNSIGQAGSMKNSQNITKQVQISLTNVLKQTAINELWNTAKGTNTAVVVNNGLIEGDNCKIVQGNTLNIRVTNVANGIQSGLQNDTFLNNLLTYSKQSQKNDDFSWLKWVFIAIVAVVVLIGLGLVLYFMFSGSSKGSGQPTPEQMKQQKLEDLKRQVAETSTGPSSSFAASSGSFGSSLGASSPLRERELAAESRVAGVTGERNAYLSPGIRSRVGQYLTPERQQQIRGYAQRFAGRLE